MEVSILIPCYNAERWLAQCLESALAQTWREKEVIVVDDGSSDGSLAIIKGFGDRVRWESGPNRGGNATRNRLLELAHGEWLQYLDADDYLLPEKISRQVKCLEACPKADVIYSEVLIEEQQSEGGPQMTPGWKLPDFPDPWLLLARWRLPQTGGSLWRKQAVLAAGGWDENMACCQEHDLYLRLLTNGARFAHCPDSGAVYRMWNEGTVSRRDPLNVARTRLQVLDRLQQELAQRRELSAERLHAINLTRFETARKFWSAAPMMSLEIMHAVRSEEPRFRPEGPAAGMLYRLVYYLVGFAAAERIAAGLRSVRHGSRM